jgi:hypothetical protein
MTEEEDEPTMEQIIEQLRKVKEMSATLPEPFRSVHKDLADLYEKITRARRGLLVHPPDKIDGE